MWCWYCSCIKLPFAVVVLQLLYIEKSITSPVWWWWCGGRCGVGTVVVLSYPWLLLSFSCFTLKKSKPLRCGGVVWCAMWCWYCSCFKLPLAVVVLQLLYIEKIKTSTVWWWWCGGRCGVGIVVVLSYPWLQLSCSCFTLNI